MPALKPIDRNKLIKKLRGFGFSGPISATRHQYMERGSEIVFISNTHGRDIGVPLLKQILKQTGIDRSEFIEM